MITLLVRSLQEDFGIPATLNHVLQIHPELRVGLDAPPVDIATSSVVQWHTWADRARQELRGWRYDGCHYSEFTVDDALLSDFTTCETTEGWECDIQDVSGVECSESDLTSFTSLDAMVETVAPHMITPVSKDKLRETLSSSKIRILHESDSSDYVVRYSWDRRFLLMSGGDSREFAAARYIAARLGVRVPVVGRLHMYRLNGPKITALRGEFDMFALSHSPTASNAFFEAMRLFRATFISTPLPRPFDDRRAILLPKAEHRSAKVATALRRAGFVDLGKHLEQLLARQ